MLMRAAPLRLVALAGIFGASALPLHALALATANDHVPNHERVATSSTLVLLHGIGSLAGPIVSPVLMELIRNRGFFLSLTAICGSLGAWAVMGGMAASQPARRLRRLLRS